MLFTVFKFDPVRLTQDPSLSVSVDSEQVPLSGESYAVGEYLFRFPLKFTGERTIRATVLLPNGQEQVRLFHIVGFDSSAAAEVHSQDQQATLSVPAQAVFHRTFVWLLPFPDSLIKTTGQELIPVSPAYAVGPTSIYYDRPVTISIAADKKPHTGLFTSRGKDGWGFLSAAYDERHRAYSGKIREHIPFLLMRDTLPPAIRFNRPGRSGDTVGMEKLRFFITDSGAGIDSDRNITATIDGQWALSEYDFENGELLITQREVKPGPHRLLISVRDNLDNENTLDFSFIRR